MLCPYHFELNAELEGNHRNWELDFQDTSSGQEPLFSDVVAGGL